MNRSGFLEALADQTKIWDLVVIGGGASGLGVALDALSRGMSVVLFEKADFAKGTSSRSTKLLHGGVRYLAQGDIALVLEALKERGLVMKNAPHISHRQSFIIPVYTWWEKIKYGLGLKIYDQMAGSYRLGKSISISKEETVQKLPNIRQKDLKGGVVYYDGQFDDARLAINLAQTCADMGGVVLNYVKVFNLVKDKEGIINGVKVIDRINKREYKINARAVVNATGVFTNKILKMDKPEIKKAIVPSQGTHLVLDISFLGSQHALMIPKTSDGRVLFCIPWYNKLLVGTTDTLTNKPKLEPKALEEEIDFILQNCADYLVKKPLRKDVLAVFAGLRPLAAPALEGAKTKEISRSHKVNVSESHLFSIVGGKWTTFRKMGEDTVNTIAKVKKIRLSKSDTNNLRIHGFMENDQSPDHLAVYGTDAAGIKKLIRDNPALKEHLHPQYPYTIAEVVWAVRHEMAVKLEDVLARRLRILFLDAKAAMEIAPKVAGIMSKELGMTEDWENEQLSDFKELAVNYILNSVANKPVKQ